MTTRQKEAVSVVRVTALICTCASLLTHATAMAQVTNPVAPIAPGAPTTPPAVNGPAATAPVASPPPAAPAPSTPAANSSSDKTGAIGFGIGVVPNSTLVGTTGAVGIKAWVSDRVVVSPLLSLRYTHATGTDAAWAFRPQVVFLLTPLASRSTRLEVGGGIAFSVSRTPPPAAVPPQTTGDTTNTQVSISVPLQAGVEHFFAPWFSMGIAVNSPLIAFTKDGDFNTFSFSIDSTQLLAQLFFYSD